MPAWKARKWRPPEGSRTDEVPCAGRSVGQGWTMDCLPPGDAVCAPACPSVATHRVRSVTEDEHRKGWRPGMGLCRRHAGHVLDITRVLGHREPGTTCPPPGPAVPPLAALGGRGMHRRFGRVPFCHRMLEWLRDRGDDGARQRDFMREYHRIGARGNSFGNDFGRFCTARRSAANQRAYNEWFDARAGTLSPARFGEGPEPDIPALIEQYNVGSVQWVRYVGPSITVPDWRPEHTIPEDYHAG